MAIILNIRFFTFTQVFRYVLSIWSLIVESFLLCPKFAVEYIRLILKISIKYIFQFSQIVQLTCKMSYIHGCCHNYKAGKTTQLDCKLSLWVLRSMLNLQKFEILIRIMILNIISLVCAPSSENKLNPIVLYSIYKVDNNIWLFW